MKRTLVLTDAELETVLRLCWIGEHLHERLIKTEFALEISVLIPLTHYIKGVFSVPQEIWDSPQACTHCELTLSRRSNGLCDACDRYERKYSKLPSEATIAERLRKRWREVGEHELAECLRDDPRGEIVTLTPLQIEEVTNADSRQARQETIIVCTHCLAEDYHGGFGLCRACYNYQRNHNALPSAELLASRKESRRAK